MSATNAQDTASSTETTNSNQLQNVGLKSLAAGGGLVLLIFSLLERLIKLYEEKDKINEITIQKIIDKCEKFEKNRRNLYAKIIIEEIKLEAEECKKTLHEETKKFMMTFCGNSLKLVKE